MRHGENINFTRVVITLALLGHQTSHSQNKFFFLCCTIYYCIWCMVEDSLIQCWLGSYLWGTDPFSEGWHPWPVGRDRPGIVFFQKKKMRRTRSKGSRKEGQRLLCLVRCLFTPGLRKQESCARPRDNYRDEVTGVALIRYSYQSVSWSVGDRSTETGGRERMKEVTDEWQRWRRTMRASVLITQRALRVCLARPPTVTRFA